MPFFVIIDLFAQNSEKESSRSNLAIYDSRLDNPRKFFVDSRINWSTHRMDITLSVMLNNRELQTRYYVNEVVKNYFSVWLYDALKNLQLDSQHTFKNFWDKNLLQSLNTVSSGILKKKYGVFSRNLDRFQLVYQVDVYPELIKIWIDKNFEPLRESILNKNPVEFSGLVIYVSDDLGVRGEPYRMTKLQPALFPKIYDENLELVWNYRNVERDVLIEKGMVRYDIIDNADNHKNLVGAYPLRISAKELFGMVQTDLIIRNIDANRLLKNSYLRNILTQGRVLILLESAFSNILYKEQ